MDDDVRERRIAVPGSALVAAFVLTLGVSGCGGGTATTTTVAPPATTVATSQPPPTTLPPTTTTQPPTTTTQPPTTTTQPPTTTTTVAPGEPLLLLPSASEFDAGWSEILFIPYGEEVERLGTSLGGDGEGFQLGPDYGAQAPDGSWWIFDAAKLRIAHYTENGDYLGATPMKREHLAQGRYFQFQLPRILADGTLVAQKLGSGTTTLLLLADGDASLVQVPVGFGLRYDDGVSLYGFSGEDGRVATRVDPHTGAPETVDWFLTRAGTRFRVEIRGDVLSIDLPDAPGGVAHDLRMVYAEDPAVPAYGLVEVASGRDGTLFFYILGGTDSGVGGQLAAFFSISPDGVVSPVERTRNPFTTADPGSPGHLGVGAGSGVPWIMIVDTDGLRVYAPE